MKQLLTIVIVFTLLISTAQETYLKTYNIKKEKIINNNYFLAKLLISNKRVDEYKDKFILKRVDYNLYKRAATPLNKMDVLDSGETAEVKSFKGVVKFEDNNLFVTMVRRKKPENNNLTQKNKIKEDDYLYFYTIKNGQTLRLSYRSFALNTLTIPIKYRRRGRTDEINSDVTASVSGVLHGGFTWGWTSFTHRQGTVNESNNWNMTWGPILGFSVVNLTSKNTLNNILMDTESLNKGLVSAGLGVTFTFNKFAGGIYYGWDYAVGKFANNWFYNKKPWIGLGIGFSLIK